MCLAYLGRAVAAEQMLVDTGRLTKHLAHPSQGRRRLVLCAFFRLATPWDERGLDED